MTDYAGIFGGRVDYVSSDPSNPFLGQVWYNSTSATLKYQGVTTTASWASGGNLGTGRYAPGGAGTQTAGLAFGGGPVPVGGTATEKYDGTSWSTNPTGLNTGRASLIGVGTQTAALAAGGFTTVATNVTEKFNGTSWTSNPTGLNTTRYELGGSGIQTSGLAFGGYTGAAYSTATETFNGTSWSTSPGNLNTARSQISGNGTQTASLAYSGSSPGPNSATESWNGTSWTNVNSLNTSRRAGGSSVSAPQTSSVFFGGVTAPPTAATGATETWNGTSWTTSTSLSSARRDVGGLGTQLLALAFGATTAGLTNATEEWSGIGNPTTKTVTVS